MDPLQKLNFGDSFPFSADVHNRTVDMIRAHLRGKQSPPAQAHNERPVYIQNCTDPPIALPIHAVVGIGEPAIAPEGQSEGHLFNIVFQSDAPTAGAPFGILQEPATAGAVAGEGDDAEVTGGGLARVMMTGETWAWLKVSDAAHKNAGPIADEYEHLTSHADPGSPAEILWVDLPTNPTLTSTISAAATSITVSTSEGWTVPAVSLDPLVIVCDTEQMRVTAISGTTWTVTRGYGGTSAAAHDAGETLQFKSSGRPLWAFLRLGRAARDGVYVKNTTAGILAQYAVVPLGAPIITPTLNEQEFRNVLGFETLLTDAAALDFTTYNANGYAILQEPLAPGAIGLAVAEGITRAKVYTSGINSFSRFAVFAHVSTPLVQSDFGPVEILWLDRPPALKLSNLISAGDTTIGVTTEADYPSITEAENWPGVPFEVAVTDEGDADAEHMLVTAIAGGVWTVTRGYNGTKAVAHNANDDINYIHKTSYPLWAIVSLGRDHGDIEQIHIIEAASGYPDGTYWGSVCKPSSNSLWWVPQSTGAWQWVTPTDLTGAVLVRAGRASVAPSYDVLGAAIQTFFGPDLGGIYYGLTVGRAYWCKRIKAADTDRLLDPTLSVLPAGDFGVDWYEVLETPRRVRSIAGGGAETALAAGDVAIFSVQSGAAACRLPALYSADSFNNFFYYIGDRITIVRAPGSGSDNNALTIYQYDSGSPDFTVSKRAFAVTYVCTGTAWRVESIYESKTSYTRLENFTGTSPAAQYKALVTDGAGAFTLSNLTFAAFGAGAPSAGYGWPGGFYVDYITGNVYEAS